MYQFTEQQLKNFMTNLLGGINKPTAKIFSSAWEKANPEIKQSFMKKYAGI